MEKACTKHCLLVIVLMAVTGVVLLCTTRSTAVGEAGVSTVLPEMVGQYRGIDVRFCQREECMAEFTVDALEGKAFCLSCGGPLDDRSVAEKRILPSDTLIAKKQYVDDKGNVIFVSVVLSGKEQRSIHRAQRCLPAQGYAIEESSSVSVPLADGGAIDVALLNLRHGSAPGQVRLSSYAYWFVGKDKATSSHFERLRLMAVDRIVHNVSHRWAYIAVSTRREPGGGEDVERLKELISVLYPAIKKK